MTDYKKRLGTAVATVALLAQSYSGLAFAGTTINITGNAANTDNDAQVNVSQNTSVNQSNTANFTNNISGDAKTGGNSANQNNGGEVNIQTGNASVNATVVNSANQNWAEVDCCDQGNTTVKIGGNAANSNNTANLDLDNNVDVDQDNDADFDNNIRYLDARTGGNDAGQNNGGDVNIQTGNASVTVNVSNWANANSARVGREDDGGSDVSLWIVGNAANSDNDITVDLNSTVDVNQNNDAYFDNNISGDAVTGGNDANQNNGGEVMVDTGDAMVDVTVDNMANFNWADVNCGCTFGEGGLSVLVDGNGFGSDNNINGDFDSNQDLDQDNDADFDNNAKDLNAKTGHNDANQNNGDADSDPAIETGDSEVNAEVSNSANLNGIGGEEPEWPEFHFGGLTITLDLGAILKALGK
jgi:hypothetical protein